MSVLAAIKRANARHEPEESIGLRVAVLVAVLAATLATLAQGVGGPGLRVAATLGIAGAFAYSHWARFRDGYLLKAFLAAGVLLAFFAFLQSATAISAGAINEVQLPLAELFLWVQFLHSLDVPARRDLMFSLLSSLVLMSVAGVLSVSASLGPNVIIWAIAAVASLVLSYRSEVGSLPSLAPRDGVSVAAARSRVRAIRPLVGVVALVAMVAMGVFLVVPAAGAGKAVAFPARLPDLRSVPRIGGLANPSLGGGDPSSTDGRTSSTGSGASASGYFGFSKSLDTSLRGRPDDSVVLRVKAARPDFWRGQSFDTWDGRQWVQSHDRPEPVSDSAPIVLRGAPEDRATGTLGATTDFVQTFYIEQQGPNLIFAAYAPHRVYFSDRTLFELDDGTVRTGVHLPEGSVYTVVSRRLPVTPEILRSADLNRDTLATPTFARYTQLPANVPGRVTDLAAKVTASAPTAYDKVRALEQWMGANTSYTLDIPRLPAGADAVEQYLFVDKQGFCEQIGTALVVMLRSLGIPARLAVGFAPGQRNPFTGMWEVRASDAHAWAEVWFPGVGWQAFDPTASVPFAGEPFSSAAGAGLAAFVKARLPHVPAGFVRGVGALLAVALPAGTVAWMLRDRRRQRRARGALSWSDLQLARLESAGARRGRSRREWESVRRYVDVLERSVLPDRRLSIVAEVVEAEAFSGQPPVAEARQRAELLLDDIEAAHPVHR